MKIALIGIDTSHTIEFARRIQAPDCEPEKRVEGMKVTSCLSFLTPFTSRKIVEERTAQLQAWGVNVTESFEEATADCDAVMLEINDAAYHLEYLEKCLNLKKPLFLDKPLADNIHNGEKIYSLAKERNLKLFSASSLRFRPQLLEACQKMNNPFSTSVYGHLGKAPAGSSIIWYGVHTFEMLEKIMGRGAISVFAYKVASGVVCVVAYPDEKHGIVELSTNTWGYSGCLRHKDDAVPFTIDMSSAYTDLLREIKKFFETGIPPVLPEETLEIMALLDGAERSFQSGFAEKISLSASRS
ncbi:MAG: Gfo/Idh/MocA family oxidoreductase [Candidatus Omnitrophica bacterium]|nr:Gfo/Idh/MocA family oxidoreductase [Candidatus Omnitrophota bacterium]